MCCRFLPHFSKIPYAPHPHSILVLMHNTGLISALCTNLFLKMSYFEKSGKPKAIPCRISPLFVYARHSCQDCPVPADAS